MFVFLLSHRDENRFEWGEFELMIFCFEVELLSAFVKENSQVTLGSCKRLKTNFCVLWQ